MFNEYRLSYEKNIISETVFLRIFNRILGMSTVIEASTKLRYSATCLRAYTPNEHFTKICRLGARTLADYLYISCNSLMFNDLSDYHNESEFHFFWSRKKLCALNSNIQ